MASQDIMPGTAEQKTVQQQNKLNAGPDAEEYRPAKEAEAKGHTRTTNLERITEVQSQPLLATTA